MLNKLKFYITTVLLFMISIDSIARRIDSIRFRDTNASEYSIETFAKIWSKKLEIQDGLYFFIVVQTRNGLDKKYIQQNEILKSMKNEFEDNHIVWIDGCAKSCPQLDGYEIIQGSHDLPERFKILIIDSKGKELISSYKLLTKGKIMEVINKVKNK